MIKKRGARKAPRRRKPSLRKQQYTEYINGPVWKAMKTAFYAVYAEECMRCGTTKSIHLHHARYPDVLGTETFDDLYPLCKTCHRRFHRIIGGSKKDMIQQTIRFIEMYQQT